jgi:asparagine synthase (glutamine-hydrolysing)
MCGLAGLYSPAGVAAIDTRAALDRMSAALVHRGPDDAGQWIDAAAGVGLAHRRLSILDLSAAGHQPMLSPSGRYVLVLNGEIYNHLEIRAALEGEAPPAWRGHSDTESLLAGFDRWGIETTVTKATGMFAFAVWDRQDRVLTLGRDRLGEKPLYYGWQGALLLFGSELKALRAHPQFVGQVDRQVLSEFLRRGFIEAPRSIFHGIFKLPPGTLLSVPATIAPGSPLSPAPYWSLRDAVHRGRLRPHTGSAEDAAAELQSLLGRSVALQSIADVSLGAFLSGGIDSSLVVALLQARSAKPVKTFTIGFREAAFDESSQARQVAAHLGTEHVELMVNAEDARRVIPRLPAIYDEPFGDSSAIPTVLVSQLARSQVTVSLSGDGGDELFGGYSRYRRTVDIWRQMSALPRGLRVPAAVLARAIAPASGAHASTLLRAAAYLSAQDAQDCYAVQTGRSVEDFETVLGAETSQSRPEGGGSDLGVMDQMMYDDTIRYLPDDILVKVDRAAMAVGLESRVPLLDHRVVEFAWRLPPELKVRDGESKWLLKKLLRERLPSALVDRPKMGFGIPVGDWLRGPLREWGESLLSAPRLRAQGLLDVTKVRNRWEHFQRGGRVSSDAVWSMLMFQAWLDA